MSNVGLLDADQVVVAAGAWTGRLSQAIGHPLPMQAGKGYSITVSDPRVVLNHALYLVDAEITCSPFESNLRIAGTMEFSGVNENIDGRRVNAMIRSVDEYLPSWRVGKKETT